MCKVVVRQSKLSDYTAIYELIVECFGERNKVDPQLRSEVINGNYLVATDHENVVATLGLCYSHALKARELTCVCTRAPYRGQGIMHRLFEEVVKRFQPNETIYCSAVRENGRQFVNLYKLLLEFGFAEVKRPYCIWTNTLNCRETFGMKCALHTTKGHCTCYEDLWVINPTPIKY